MGNARSKAAAAMGRAKTPAKAKAARANGAKGGRPANVYEVRMAPFHDSRRVSGHITMEAATRAKQVYNRRHTRGDESCTCGGATIVRVDGAPLSDAERDAIYRATHGL